MNSIRNSTQTKSKSNFKTNKTTWSNYSSSALRLVEFEKSTSYDAVPEITNLVQELVQVEGLKRVKAIATSFPDIHWVDFEIELEADIELSNETWEKIQDMVIDCEWKLIDDSAEEWYFRPQIVDRFYLLRDKVIADSDEKQHTGRKIWSSNLPNFNVVK